MSFIVFCSLIGSAAVACMEYGCYHCIVAEKDKEKLLMIRRRFSKAEKERLRQHDLDLSY